MRAVDLIQKKRDGQALTEAEINWFIEGVTDYTLPDYQISALLMAIYFQGMSREETVALTLAMAQSGQMLDLSDIAPYIVDKHSSGGVGDKTSLVVLPLVAACGVPIAKMSGRGLGFSGGTLDKLESIAGFRVDFSDSEFRQLAREQGLVLSGQTSALAPADGRLYALRDVTATVPSLPLIASSIMSKKLASGANGIVLDVKLGTGAFMATLQDARELAQIMVNIGVDAGRDMIALLSDMNQPLGRAVGNALETREAIETLRGGGVPDFHEHCIEIALQMLKLAGQSDKWADEQEVRELLEHKLKNGEALSRFRQMVEAQGGDVTMVDEPLNLPRATLRHEIKTESAGYTAQVSAIQVAQAALALGAGREKKDDAIDMAVGVEVLTKVGDFVQADEVVAIIHANDEFQAEQAQALLNEAIKLIPEKVEPLPLFYGKIEGMAKS